MVNTTAFRNVHSGLGLGSTGQHAVGIKSGSIVSYKKETDNFEVDAVRLVGGW